MHARHRIPGEAVRVNSSFGVGQSSSRASPESGLRHFSPPLCDYKNSSRGVGRGAPKPPLPARKADILMEAGRLAAEYLASQGLLPASSVVQKGQNGNVAGFWKESPEVRAREREIPVSDNGSPSRVRFGGLGFDAAGSLAGRDEEARRRPLAAAELFSGGKRKLLDDPMDCKSQFKDSRKSVNLRTVGQGWTREDSRSGPPLEKGGVEFSTTKGSDNELTAYQGEKRIAIDSAGIPKRVDSMSSKSEVAGDSDSDLENYEFPDTTDPRPFYSSMNKNKDVSGTEDSLQRKLDKVEPGSSTGIEREDSYLSSDVGKVRDSLHWMEREMPNPLHQRFGKGDTMLKDSRGSTPGDASKGQASMDENIISKLSDQSIRGTSSDGIDLVQLCSLGQVPTKARSVARHKTTDAEHGIQQHWVSMREGRNPSNLLSARGSNALKVDDFVEESAKDLSQSCRTRGLRGSVSESTRVLTNRTADEAGDMDPSVVIEKDRFARSHSFSDRTSFIHQQESNRWPPGFGSLHGGDVSAQDGRTMAYGRSRSMFQQRDMDNAMFRGNRWDGNKRQREWPSTRISQADEYFRLHNLKAKQSVVQAKGSLSLGEEFSEAVEQKELMEETVSVKKDPNLVTSESLFPDLGSNEEQQSLLIGSKTIEDMYNQNLTATEDEEDHVTLTNVQQKASAQVARLLAKIHKGGSDESSIPVLEEGHQIECNQQDEGIVLAAEPETNRMEIEEASVLAFFQDIFKDYPLLRKFYQSEDTSSGFDCLVCFSSTPTIERKFVNMDSLLKHATNDSKMPLVHKGFALAIRDLLSFDFSESPLKDVESSEAERKPPLQNENEISVTDEPGMPSLEGVQKDMSEN
eukprot:Gb_06930 [translate_table: standard]